MANVCNRVASCRIGMVKLPKVNDNKLPTLEDYAMREFQKEPFNHWVYFNDITDFCLVKFSIFHVKEAVYKDAKKNLTSIVRFFIIIKY